MSKFLVVDDNARNLMDAFNCLKAAGHQVVFASCPRHTGRMMKCIPGIQGVISDLFMPNKPEYSDMMQDFFADTDVLKKHGPYSTEEEAMFEELDLYSRIEYVIAKHELSNADASQPTGLLACERARKYKLPVVLCTSVKRHGLKVKWVEELHGFFNDIIGAKSESCSADDEGEKDWSNALASLEYAINASK